VSLRLAARVTLMALLLSVLLVLLARAALARWAEARWTAAAARYEREVGSLDPRSWDLPTVADAEANAATWIAKGAAALVVDGVVTGLASKSPSTWTSEDLAAIRHAAKINHEALAIIARARSCEASSYGIRVRGAVEARLPDLKQITSGGRLLFARAVLARRDGRREDALADLELLGAIARSLGHERVLVVTLVGAAMERLQLRLVHAFVEDPETSSAEIARLDAGILSGDLLADYRHGVAAAGAAACSAVHESLPILGDDHERAVLHALRPVLDPARAAACLDAYREIGVALGRPHHEAGAKLAEIASQLHSSWLPREFIEKGIPHLVTQESRMTTNLSLRNLARLALSARARALDTGEYPADLGAVERDPLTGGLPRWRLASDGTAALELPGAAEIVAEVMPSSGIPLPWSFRLPRVSPARRSTSTAATTSSWPSERPGSSFARPGRVSRPRA